MWGSAVRVCPGLPQDGEGGLAQLARAPALQAGGQGFDSLVLHGSMREARARFFDRMGEKADTKTKTHERRRAWRRDASARRQARARSEARRTEDALAPGGEEGRGRPRKSTGRRERPLIRGFPNGATRHAQAWHPSMTEANPTNRNIPVVGGEENKSDPPSSGERKGASPNRGRRGARGVAGPATRKKQGQRNAPGKAGDRG